MSRFVAFAWPLRWPALLLLSAANLFRYVPPLSRDVFMLVSLGATMLLALRLFFADHEAREDKMAENRETRLRLVDDGMEALARTLRNADAELATQVGKLSQRLHHIDGVGGTLDLHHRRLLVIEESPLIRGAKQQGSTHTTAVPTPGATSATTTGIAGKE